MNIKKYLAFAFSTVLMVTSCTEEIIEIEPETAVTPAIATKRVSGINSMILSAYRRVHNFGYYGQNQILNAEALADNLVIANNTGRYTGQVVNGQNSHFGTWSAGPWSIINDANLVLKYADESTPGLRSSGTLAGFPEPEEWAAPKRKRYKGEALFLRSLAYHDLVKVYGYEPGKEVNGFNLGVIIRTTPTEKVSDADKRARSTNVEVYQLLEADLKEAINLLPADADFIGASPAVNPNQQWPASERRFRASKESAKALLARVYLYWGKYAEAQQYATEVLAAPPAGTAATLTTAATHVASFATAAGNPESLFEAHILSADWSSVDGVNNSMASITNSTSGSNAQFAVAGSAELYAAYEPNDVRRNLWVNNSGRWECRKYTGEKGNFVENIALIRRAEVLLINAEAKFRQNNEAGAQADLTLLRNNRFNPAPPAVTATGAALEALILNERRVELAFEGHRFFDLKRLGMNIPKPAALNMPEVPYTDFRILANIPSGEVNYNELLQQNPNY